MSSTSYSVKVDGIEFEMPNERAVAHDILERAEKEGALSRAPSTYELKSASFDDKVYGWDDEVDFSEDNVFFAINRESTPTA